MNRYVNTKRRRRKPTLSPTTEPLPRSRSAELDFVAKLLPLVPPPRVNLIRYHGVFGPHSKLRAVIGMAIYDESMRIAQPTG